MAESSQDDVIVIVVKDDNDGDVDEQHVDLSVIKSEPIFNTDDEQLLEFQGLLQTVFKDGENIKTEQFVKDEEIELDGDILYKPEQNILSSDDEPSNFPKEKVNRNKRTSFIHDICKAYPKYEKSETDLIEVLVTQMRSVQRPVVFDAYEETDEGCFVCSVCSVEKPSIGDIEKHYYTQHGPKYHICLACGAGFRSNLYLYKHEKRCQSPDAKHVLAARAVVLGNKSRAGRKPKGFDRRDMKAKRFLCDLCPATFVAKTSLIAHKYMHRAEKPYQCEVCPQAYTSKCVLYKHRLTHSSDSFTCDHCGRTFNTKNKIISHIYSHLPPRFSCKECPKKYSYRAALLLHVHEVHRKLPPPCACQLCPKRFRRMWLLKDHMKNEHGMDLITRRMFFTQFSSMGHTKIENAKIVLRSEVQRLGDMKQMDQKIKEEPYFDSSSSQLDRKSVVKKNKKTKTKPTVTQPPSFEGEIEIESTSVVPVEEENDPGSIKVVLLDENEVDYDTLTLQYQLSDYARLGRNVLFVENGSIKELNDEEYQETLDRLNNV